MFKETYGKIVNKKAKVAVIGLGYVGLPNLVNIGLKGFDVIGLDVDTTKIELLKKGQSYISDVASQDVQELIANQQVSFSHDFKQLEKADVIFIDVPTPIDQHKVPDNSFVETAAKSIIQSIQPGQLIILESTVFPNTTNEFIVKPLLAQGVKVGTEVFVAYSPERINPGCNLPATPKVVGGYTEDCATLTSLILEDNTYVVSNTTTAELAKLHENTFRFVNIALANELTQLCATLAINPFEVIEASNSKPFGFMKFMPSVGIGGHCIPVDPYFTTWYMKQFTKGTPLIEAAGQVNDSMIDYTVKRIVQSLTNNQVPLFKARINIIGATYKANVPDTRMTPVQHLVAELATYQIECCVYDDLVSSLTTQTGQIIPVLDIDYSELSTRDLSLLLVNHDYLDYDLLEKNSQLLIDTKNVYYRSHNPNIMPI